MTVKQILLVNILGNVYRTVWRIYILISGSKGLITLVRITWTESVPTFVRNFEICPLPQPRSRAIGKCLRKENKVRKESKLIIFLTTKNIYRDKPWDVPYSVDHPFSNLGKKKTNKFTGYNPISLGNLHNYEPHDKLLLMTYQLEDF